jgi:hypothetical protein
LLSNERRQSHEKKKKTRGGLFCSKLELNVSPKKLRTKISKLFETRYEKGAKTPMIPFENKNNHSGHHSLSLPPSLSLSD